MTAKEYLSQAAVLKRRIEEVEYRIEQIETEMSSPKGVRYDKPMIQSSPTSDSLAYYVARLQNEKEKKQKLKDDYLDMYHKLECQINCIMPELYCSILTRVYLQHKTLVVVSKELNYSYVQMCRLHGFALLTFARTYPDIIS